MSEQLRLHDTRSGEIRPFEPRGQVVTLYVCGVTPYDTTHLGHGFTFVAFDVLVRYLEYLGYRVRYVQNVTDVDDPLFEKARQLGETHEALAAHQIERYVTDMQSLNVRQPTVFPRASDEIPGMVPLIVQLIEAGHAYIADGHVYFSVATDATYGELSKYDRGQMLDIARERGGNPDDPLHRDPLDFLLWRPSNPGEPRAPSPWGEGLPGWHIECSTMALKYLGPTIDIHGGGSDLIFPHHESEIAQSESVTGIRPFVRFWMHTGMVYLGGEKMSKSLGNMVFIKDLVSAYGADAVRVYLMSCHYRGELHFQTSDLDKAYARAQLIRSAVDLHGHRGTPAIDVEMHRSRFTEHLNADLNTPGAIDLLEELARDVIAAHGAGNDVRSAQEVLRELGHVLGLTFA